MYCEERLHIDMNTKGNFNDVNWVRTWRSSPDDDTLSAPTIADVVMWIYNTHRIWISPYQYRDHAADANDEFVFRTHQTGMQEFKSPIEAYEAAIKDVCEYKIK